MSKRFDKSLAAATDQTVLETDWDAVLDCVDQIRGGETKASDAMTSVLARLKHENHHVVLHTLVLLEAMVKNCGKKVHAELATREFMEGIKELAIDAKAESVKTKVLELLQCWAMAFANKAEYKIVVDTHNLMKLAGFDFPSVKEADAMFASQVAPEWEEGTNCFRCRTEFTFLTRKHHCRACGQIFCHGCSSKEMLLPQFGIEKPVRVCDACHEKGVGVPLGKQSSGQPRSKFDDAHTSSLALDYEDEEWEVLGEEIAANYQPVEPRQRADYNGADWRKSRSRRAEKPDGLFKSLLRGLVGGKQKSPDSVPIPAPSDPNAEERERQARLQREKEEEEYQLNLAMAISQSEAEAKEKERATSMYSFYNGVKDQVAGTTVSNQDSISIAPSENIGIYKGAAESVRESPSENSLNADDPLARYLNRDYWQQRKEKANAKVESWEVNPSAPLPSEPSLGGGSCVPTVTGSPPPIHKELVSAVQNTLDDETILRSEDTKKFCADVNEQVESMENRIRSNMARGRPIYNDTAIQGLYQRLTELHSQVMQRMHDLEQQRGYYESLQDHLGHITEARAAVNALREEEARKRAEIAAEEQRIRQVQMQHKLAAMRQQKHDMLLYQRQVAIQRFQQQEAEMAARRSQQFYTPNTYGAPQVPHYAYNQMNPQYPAPGYGNYPQSVPQPVVSSAAPQQLPVYNGQQVNGNAGGYIQNPAGQQAPGNGYPDNSQVQQQTAHYMPHTSQTLTNAQQTAPTEPAHQGYHPQAHMSQPQHYPVSHPYEATQNPAQYSVAPSVSQNQYYQQQQMYQQPIVGVPQQHYQQGLPGGVPAPNGPVASSYQIQPNVQQPSEPVSSQEGLLISFD